MKDEFRMLNGIDERWILNVKWDRWKINFDC